MRLIIDNYNWGLLLFWHAPLGVHSAIRRHHPPQRTVLGQVDCFVQCEVVGSQISLDGVQPCDTRTPWWSLPVLWWGAVRIIWASASSSCIRAMCPSKERRFEWSIAVRSGCLVILLTSSLQKNWCHLIPSSVLKHHWSRASILLASTFVIAQHSDHCRKICRIQVLYNFNFVGIEMRDFQKWLSRLCITARVIPLRRMMSGVFCVDEWMTEPRYTTWSTTATCWPWTVMVDGIPEQFYLSGASLPRLVWKKAKLSVSEWNLSLLSWPTRCSTTVSVRRLPAHCPSRRRQLQSSDNFKCTITCTSSCLEIEHSPPMDHAFGTVFQHMSVSLICPYTSSATNWKRV